MASAASARRPLRPRGPREGQRTLKGGLRWQSPPLGRQRDSSPYHQPMPRFEVQSVAELQARMSAERSGVAFLLFRDGDGHQQIVTLGGGIDSVALGRDVDPGVQLAWDPRISRLHARLERVGGAWTVLDDGLSRNGTL